MARASMLKLSRYPALINCLAFSILKWFEYAEKFSKPFSEIASVMCFCFIFKLSDSQLNLKSLLKNNS
tara:strand:- start:143 stop:346 length:204 start_codon:yes stop_codon:yes gene_type:complete